MSKEQNPNVLVLIDWYLPGFKAGGPIQSVANLVSNLSNHINFSIVTRDSDFGNSEPYANIESDGWVQVDERVRICYLSESKQNLGGLKSLIDPDDYDYIYLNSVFSYRFTILPLLTFKSSKAKLILAPRGMLGKGALELKSLKKKLFLKAAQFPGLFDGLIWQATSDQEKLEILEVFGENSIVKVVSNIPAHVPAHNLSRDKQSGILNLVFISRISEKKNPLGLLEWLTDFEGDGEISLDLYGPIEDLEYWSKCKSIIGNLPVNIRITYKGEIKQSEIMDLLRKYHVFTLLTKHENFGHAIFEALSAGCPLIISDTTPWRNLEEFKIGWDLSLDEKNVFISAIKHCLAMNQDEYTKFSDQAHAYAQEYIEKDVAIQQSLSLFKE